MKWSYICLRLWKSTLCFTLFFQMILKNLPFNIFKKIQQRTSNKPMILQKKVCDCCACRRPANQEQAKQKHDANSRQRLNKTKLICIYDREKSTSKVLSNRYFAIKDPKKLSNTITMTKGKVLQGQTFCLRTFLFMNSPQIRRSRITTTTQLII